MEEVRTYLPHWLWPGDDRSRAEIEDEIEEELRLHMDLLTQANQQAGMDASEARHAAQQRFGDIEAVRQQCVAIKRGDVPMLSRIQAVLTVLLLVAVLIVGWRQWVTNAATAQFMNQTTSFLKEIRQDMQGLREGLQPPTEPGQPMAEAPVVTGAVAGVVRNESGEPIEGARVLAVFKSWPGGSYSQEGRTMVTDAQGRFRFDDAAPLNRNRGIQIAVFADGFAFQSRYEFSDSEAKPQDLQDFDFQLRPSIPVVLQLLPSYDQRVTTPGAYSGPIYNRTTFRPGERQTADGESHRVYRENIELIEVESDEQGRVTLPWFAAGDTAEFAVRRGSELITSPLLVIDQLGRTELKRQGQEILTPVTESP